MDGRGGAGSPALKMAPASGEADASGAAGLFGVRSSEYRPGAAGPRAAPPPGEHQRRAEDGGEAGRARRRAEARAEPAAAEVLGAPARAREFKMIGRRARLLRSAIAPAVLFAAAALAFAAAVLLRLSSAVPAASRVSGKFTDERGPTPFTAWRAGPPGVEACYRAAKGSRPNAIPGKLPWRKWHQAGIPRRSSIGPH
jgi:hypothetical protein